MNKPITCKDCGMRRKLGAKIRSHRIVGRGAGRIENYLSPVCMECAKGYEDSEKA